ncbi:MAG: decarboxylating 6-phosphogluconate dehydrogenase, partial [Nitrospinota bacterium]|nr:decarboxylating 6-phosphogluconate dehydrogenase [Nitrospinota bacterium]
MQLGMVGLGRMGANMVRRLLGGGHESVIFDLNPDNVKALAAEGAAGADSLDDFVSRLAKPRAAWVMVPAGGPTEETVQSLAARMEPGDIIIDGGNSYYKDDVRRAAALDAKGIHYVDVGTSGGVWGVERGYCLMIGGGPEAVKRLDPIFKTLAPGRGEIERTPGREAGAMESSAEEGYIHCGPAGAGHFVKMVHNGIEYGLMQAYAEGFDILRNADSEQLPEGHRFTLNLADIAEVWRRGSVVGSWLLDLTAMVLVEDP